MRNSRHILLAAGLLMFFAAPAEAQLAGADTSPGDSCAGFPAGAARVTADADQDGKEITLICDGTTWNAADSGGGSSLWQLNGSDIYYNSGSVGIGTPTPTTQFEIVSGDSSFEVNQGATVQIYSADSSNISAPVLFVRNADVTDGQSQGIQIWAGNGASDYPLWIADRSSAVDFFTVRGDGKVGVGTASPAAALHVNGEAIIGNTSLACSGTTEGALRYSSASQYVELCDGSTWKPLAQVQTTGGPTAPAGSGYFVLTETTWSGDLGGLTGADAKCLTELGTTYTSWRGYSTANSNGQITAGKVHAFLCDNGSCNNLMPLTTYYFAYANSGAPGGASFTTDASGVGPNDNALWSAANYFSGTYTYWMGRNVGFPDDHWENVSAWTHCYGWTDNTGGEQGTTGYSATSAGARIWQTEPTCDNSNRLICFVNP